MKKNILLQLAVLLTVFVGQAFAQTTLRIEDASSFTSGFCLFDGSRQNSYTGASNGYYINITNSSAKGINWKINAPSAGPYTLKWRYANGGSNSATPWKIHFSC
jgi:pectate disaccharide-lyase